MPTSPFRADSVPDGTQPKSLGLAVATTSRLPHALPRTLTAQLVTVCSARPTMKSPRTVSRTRNVPNNDLTVDAGNRAPMSSGGFLSFSSERSISWLVAGGNRRLRYRGAEKNRQWLVLRVAVLNVRRLVNLGLGH